MSGSGAQQGAGLTLQEVNVPIPVTGVSTTKGAIVAAFNQGPVGPNIVTSTTSFTTQYGPIDLSVGFGHISSLAFLSTSNFLTVNRVVDAETCCYASLDVFNGSNALGTNNFTYLTPATNLTLPFENAATANANELLTYTIYASGGPLTTGSSVTISIDIPNEEGDGATSITVGPVAFSQNNDTTMQNIASAISLALNNAGILCTATAINSTDGTTCQTIQVLIDFTAENEEFIAFTNFVVSGSTVVMQEQNNDLFQVFALNPGSFGNNIGIQITTAQTAPPPQITLNTTLTNAEDGLVISGFISFNNATFSVSASGSSAEITAKNFINALTDQFGGVSTGVFSITGNQNPTLTIIMYAPTFGSTWVVGNGGFKVTDITTSTILSSTTAVNSNSNFNNFVLNVFVNGATTPTESFTVSLQQQVDGFGNQQFIEDVVNTGVSGAPSQYIQVVYTGASSNPAGNVTPSFITGLNTGNTSPIVLLGGGQDGLQPTNAEIVNGWNAMSSTEEFAMNILINSGNTATAVAQAMVNLAATRQDCFAVLDIPQNMQNADAATAYVGSTLGINSSYGAIYAPWLQILDTVNNQLVFVPPSGYVAAQYALTDKNFAVWLSAAGPVRGVLNNVLALQTVYDVGDRALLASFNINAIKAARNGSGNMIFDVLTLSTPLSLLSYVSIRRTFIFLEQSILTALETYLFDNITPQTEFLVTQAINGFLQPIQNQQGISNFFVLCNTTNNTANTTDGGVLNITVYIVPVVPARVIALKAVVTPASVSFSELISQGIF
jgi:uncharacterized protein